MTSETFNSRRPFKTELRIIHQYTDPNSTKDRTLREIIDDVGGDQLILDLISYGLACDHYEEWKDHPNETVRLGLAINGYFLDHYIHDIDDQIKYVAISKQPELIYEMLSHPSDDELRFARDYLYDQSLPDVTHLKAYVEANGEPKNGKDQALLTKYLSETTELDTLTKTMTSAQLFAMDHPAWALRYAPEAIATIQDVVHALENSGYVNKGDYANILFDLANEYQNDDYHYYLELYADAVLTIKEQVSPTNKRRVRGAS